MTKWCMKEILPTDHYAVSLFCSKKHPSFLQQKFIQLNIFLFVFSTNRTAYIYLFLYHVFVVFIDKSDIFLSTKNKTQSHSQTASSDNFFILSAELLFPGRKICPCGKSDTQDKHGRELPQWLLFLSLM